MLLPVRSGSGISYFDGPPIVTALGFCVHNGRLTEPVDLFAHPFWDHVGRDISGKTLALRRQGFYGNAMLALDELSQSDIITIARDLDDRFIIRKEARTGCND